MPSWPTRNSQVPGADVAGLGEDRLRRRVQLPALLVGQVRRRRLLDELLVAPLQRAVPRGDDDDLAVPVGQALGLHVSRLVEEALDEALAATEGGDRLAHGALVQLGDLLEGAGHLQAAAAAAERRLDGDRQTVLACELHHLVGAGDRVRGAGHQRRPDLLRDVPGPDLVAERVDGRRRGTDPGQPGVGHRLGEAGVLGQEAVPGVHRVRAGPGRHGEQLADVQVRLAGCRPAERERLVARAHVQRVAVLVGVDGDAAQTGVAARPGDPDRDLPAVGDQHLAHGVLRLVGLVGV